jgi:ubiquinone/menaquinone biosynthesis C-methylase UbiE
VSGAHAGGGGRPYVCGHEPRELDRLDLQGAFYADITRRALIDAGVGEGMRVLDIGCGSGDVTLLAADLVGPGGHVTGVDRDPGSVEAARARAAARGVEHVAFLVGEVDAPRDPGSVDAVVGRFVLMHQDDPAATLAAAARAVRPGGVVAFVESFMAGLLDAPHSHPRSQLYDRVVRWKCAVVAAAGADVEAGVRLRRTYLEAGLPAPALRMETRVEGGPDSPIYRYFAESARSMLPMAERFGLRDVREDEVDTLEDALRRERVATDGVLIAWPLVCAWCRVPAV